MAWLSSHRMCTLLARMRWKMMTLRNKLAGALIAIFIFAGSFCAQASAQQMSALIADAMDKQLPENIDFSGTLPEAIAKFGDLTGVRIEADNSVYNMLPWGDLTTFSAKFQHETLRQALSAICQKLGLEFELGTGAVELHPIPALRRLGRRSTVEELQALDFLAKTSLGEADTHLMVSKLIADVDEKLKASREAIEDRAFVAADKTPVNIARNATLLEALEEIPAQTGATWYPWGKTIVIAKKPDQTRMQLTKHVSTRYTGQDVSAVLLDLSQRSGIDFQIEPGAIAK